MRYLAPAALAAALLATTPVWATTITGNYSLAITDTTGDWTPSAAANLQGVLNNPFSFGFTSPGDQDSASFFIATPPSEGSRGTTARIIATLSNLSDGTPSISSEYEDDANWFANYSNQTDAIEWVEPGFVVNFEDGAQADVFFVNASDWAIEPGISFTLTDLPTPAPEPSALALLGGALLLFATTRRYIFS